MHCSSLGLFTFNLFNIFYTNVYKEILYSELYVNIRKMKYNTLTNKELLNDNKLYINNYIEESYPEEINNTRSMLIVDANKNYSLNSYILLFFTFSFIGWVWEVMLHLVSDGVFVNRGTMFGPWLSIYGFGGVFILFLLKPFREKPTLLFITAFILCGIIEYSTAWYLETFKHLKYWDYSEIKEFQVYQLNLNPFEKRYKRYINESIYETGEKSSKIYTKNKRIVLKYLEYYHYLYYNLGIRMEEVVILASLISKSFKEFYLMMLNIFSKKDADDILRRMISMNINGFAVGEMWSKERYDYIAAEKEKEIIERELQDSLELGRKDGIAIGKEQGISIGKEQGISIGTIETKENIVNNMLRKNMPYELISEVSDVPVEEVKKLAKRLSSQVS